MLDEIQIIEGCINKDQRCQKLLYEKYAPYLYGIALRYTKTEQDAQDVLQESFLRIFDNLELYEGKGNFLGWLIRIVVNHALNYNYVHSKVRTLDFANYEERIADEPITDSNALTHQVLLEFIRELPQGYQSVFNLCVIEGYSSDEVAKMLNCTSITCRTQLLKAKTLLRKKIGDFLINEYKLEYENI